MNWDISVIKEMGFCLEGLGSISDKCENFLFATSTMTLPLFYQVWPRALPYRQRARIVHHFHLLQVLRILRILWYLFMNIGTIKICSVNLLPGGTGDGVTSVEFGFPRRSVTSGYWRFRQTHCLHFQGRRIMIASYWLLFLLPYPEDAGIRSSETNWKFYQTRRRHIPENMTPAKPLFTQLLFCFCPSL